MYIIFLKLLVSGGHYPILFQQPYQSNAGHMRFQSPVMLFHPWQLANSFFFFYKCVIQTVKSSLNLLFTLLALRPSFSQTIYDSQLNLTH